MLIYSDWDSIDSDEKRDMIRYLKTICALQMIDKHQEKLLRQVCIPALEDHDGQIIENMDTVNKIASYGYSLLEVNKILSEHYQAMKVWISVKKATKYLSLSAGYIRQLARRGVPFLEAKKHPKGWRINTVSIIDYLIRTKKVQIA